VPGARAPLADIRVLFCSPGFPRSRELLRERLAGSPLRIVEVEPGRSLEAQVGEASALIPSMARISAAVMAAAPLLKLIVQFGAGLEGVDRAAAEARGIAVRNVAGANAQAVAELAVFLMLALARGLPQHRRSFAARLVGDPAGSELRGKTLGVVGLGASGRALAGIARGFGMDVIAVRRTPAPDPHASWVGGPAAPRPRRLCEPACTRLRRDPGADRRRAAGSDEAFGLSRERGPRRAHRPSGASGRAP